MEQAPVRGRFPERRDELRARERHDLAYTVIAVLVIALLGAIIVPITVSRSSALPVASDAQRLADRYLEAIVQVKGATPPANAATVVKQYGADGGTTCRQSLPTLYESAIVRPKAAPGTRGASYLDHTKLETVRTALRVYCPARDEQLATFLNRA